VTESELVLGGSGEGTYSPDKVGGAIQFFTPFFDIFDGDGNRTLTATLYYSGSAPSNFVLSDYCPGVDGQTITVVKDVQTEYDRAHDWSIAKKVETDNGYEKDGYPKIWLYTDGAGDESAEWTVDVTYEGYEDSGHRVFGSIVITNVGQDAKTITTVVDELAGTVIDVTCPVTLPHTLDAAETLTCTYSEWGYVEGYNVVTVTVEGEDDPYTDTVAIVWGDPENEYDRFVDVTDTNPGLAAKYTAAELTLDAHDYAEGDVETFTYSDDFAWADYG
jgi:hypothetical protein